SLHRSAAIASSPRAKNCIALSASVCKPRENSTDASSFAGELVGAALAPSPTDAGAAAGVAAGVDATATDPVAREACGSADAGDTGASVGSHPATGSAVAHRVHR